jgi:hypothetical protein
MPDKSNHRAGDRGKMAKARLALVGVGRRIMMRIGGYIRPDGWEPKDGRQRAIPVLGKVQELLRALPRRTRWVFTAAGAKYPLGDHHISERRLLASLRRVLTSSV